MATVSNDMATLSFRYHLRRARERRELEELMGFNDIDYSESTNSIVMSRLWKVPAEKATAMGPEELLHYWQTLIDRYHSISFEIVGPGGRVG